MSRGFSEARLARARDPAADARVGLGAGAAGAARARRGLRILVQAMSERAWRYLALALLAAVAVFWWRDCQRPRRADRAGVEARDTQGSGAARRAAARATGDRRAASELDPALDRDETWSQDPEDEAPPPLPDWREQAAQHWAVQFLTPHPGESLLEYRDRVVPVAQLAVAPHRARVASQRQRFVTDAALDAAQEQALESAVQQAAYEIQDTVMQAVLSGELDPARIKPATAVAFARDILDLLDRANRELRGALSSEQLEILDASGFDVVDYLMFSTRWEDLLGVVE